MNALKRGRVRGRGRGRGAAGRRGKQGRAGRAQGRAGQGSAGQGQARQGRAGQKGRAGQGRGRGSSGAGAGAAAGAGAGAGAASKKLARLGDFRAGGLKGICKKVGKMPKNQLLVFGKKCAKDQKHQNQKRAGAAPHVREESRWL